MKSIFYEWLLLTNDLLKCIKLGTGAAASKEFNTSAEVEQFFDRYVNSKDASFFVEGFSQLSTRWENIVESGGEYYED